MRMLFLSLFLMITVCPVISRRPVNGLSFEELNDANRVEIRPTSLSGLSIETRTKIDDPEKVAFALQFIKARPDGWQEQPADAAPVEFILDFFEGNEKVGVYSIGPAENKTGGSYLKYGYLTKEITAQERTLLIETLELPIAQPRY